MIIILLTRKSMAYILNLHALEKLEKPVCEICNKGYKPNQNVVLFACQHIFHPECFTTCVFNSCPICTFNPGDLCVQLERLVDKVQYIYQHHALESGLGVLIGIYVFSAYLIG